MGNIVFNDEVGKTLFFGHEKLRFFNAEKRSCVGGMIVPKGQIHSGDTTAYLLIRRRISVSIYATDS